jgi:hypothetical protein
MRDKNNGRFVKGLEPYNKIKLSIRHINGIVDLYRTEGKGLSEIGKRVGRSKTVIKRVLIENGVIIRRLKFLLDMFFIYFILNFNGVLRK